VTKLDSWKSMIVLQRYFDWLDAKICQEYRFS